MRTIKKSSDFKKVYAGKKFYTNFFAVHFITGNDTSLLPAFGFTVSKKTVSKKAVARNLVRRRLKEAVMNHFNPQNFCGYQFVLTAIKTTKDAKWDDYVNCIEYCQKRIQKMSIDDTTVTLTV